MGLCGAKSKRLPFEGLETFEPEVVQVHVPRHRSSETFIPAPPVLKKRRSATEGDDFVLRRNSTEEGAFAIQSVVANEQAGNGYPMICRKQKRAKTWSGHMQLTELIQGEELVRRTGRKVTWGKCELRTFVKEPQQICRKKSWS
eukprot:TRINITY_DN66728_c0_g1_i1.p2 TRINITY_DN66728_c0_g1~~TRINITY_DN66728_c0_g1_i1.p2  ORF type:complete len:144 (-),score=19.66 TRINITY_DN66728_c0_g1_i1:198-629(-)